MRNVTRRRNRFKIPDKSVLDTEGFIALDLGPDFFDPLEGEILLLDPSGYLVMDSMGYLYPPYNLSYFREPGDG